MCFLKIHIPGPHSRPTRLKNLGRGPQESAFKKSFPGAFDGQTGLIITGLGRLFPIWSDLLRISISIWDPGKGDSFFFLNSNLFIYLFIYIFIYLFFIYFWLCWVFVSVRGLSLVAASGGHSSSQCAGLFTIAASLVAEHMLQTCRLSS